MGMEGFRAEFDKRCEEVNKQLVNFRVRHPHPANPANGVHTPKEAKRIKDLENMVRQLYSKCDKHKKQCEKLVEKLHEKDKRIRSYEDYYKKLKGKTKQVQMRRREEKGSPRTAQTEAQRREDETPRPGHA